MPNEKEEKDEEPLSPDVSVKDEAAENMDLQDTSAVGKVRALLGMLTRFMGVKDIVNLRISLPASLLDPVSNLEYWNYMDRPDLFALIPDSEDPLDRMLNVIKWWYSKETKWMNGKVAKPYNSILGEQFLCHWDVDVSHLKSAPHSPAVAILRPYAVESDHQSATPTLNPNAKVIKVHCITEQISHHPPVSAYYYYCKEKGIIARGVDHMCAKFTGTSVKIYSGNYNNGIFITLESRDNEEYNATHPSGVVSGWLKASLWVSVCDETIITCPKTGLRAVLEYKEEPYFGRAKFAVQGKITRYDPKANPESLPKKVSKIPDNEVLCHISGSWKGQVLYKKTALAGSIPSAGKSTNSLESDSSFHTANTKFSLGPLISYPIQDAPEVLLDMSGSEQREKILPPIEEQDEMESRRIWKLVTENIISGNFNDATKEKRALEDKQRADERDRKAKNEPYQSKWFGFIDETAIAPSIRPEKDLIIEGGEASKLNVIGKPFLRKCLEDKFPWNQPPPSQ